MAEQFNKAHISPREFIISWEKEVYELNNLDYFIFLLINELAARLEKDYFSRHNPAHILYLDNDDIGNLAFNIGDSLQLFFEKNCFGSCSLKCPVNLNAELKPDDRRIHGDLLSDLTASKAKCSKKEQCLHADILNYVVLDSVIDFYNYEMRVILDEKDTRLIGLSEFIITVIMEFIKHDGQKFLQAPAENAGSLFNELMLSTEDPWEEILPEADDDLEEDQELWRATSPAPQTIIQEFCDNYRESFDDTPVLRVIHRFGEYLSDFLDIRNIDDLTVEDIEEFFMVVLPQDLLTESDYDLTDIRDIFQNFLAYIEFNHDKDLVATFHIFVQNSFPEIDRTLNITRQYQKQNPLIEYLLDSSEEEESEIEGFFEIVDRMDNYFVLEDIHLKSKFKPVDLSRLPSGSLEAGDIIHMQLIMSPAGWQLSHLEMVYPAKSKFYLY